MKSKMIVLAMAVMLIAAGSLAFAKSSHLKGKVTAVSGNSITIEVEKGSTADVSVGDSVELETKSEKKAPKKGSDMMQGC